MSPVPSESAQGALVETPQGAVAYGAAPGPVDALICTGVVREWFGATETQVSRGTPAAVWAARDAIYDGTDIIGLFAHTTAQNAALYRWSRGTEAWSLIVDVPGSGRGVEKTLIRLGGSWFFATYTPPGTDVAVFWEYEPGGVGLQARASMSGPIYRIVARGADPWVVGGFSDTDHRGSFFRHIAYWQRSDSTWRTPFAFGEFGVYAGFNTWIRDAALVGARLYVGGDFTTIDWESPPNPQSIPYVAYTDHATGLTWSGAGDPGNVVRGLEAVAAGELYAGVLDSGSTWRAKQGNGSTWSNIGATFNNVIHAARLINAQPWMGGDFTSPQTGVARWNGSTWLPAQISMPGFRHFNRAGG